MLNNKIRVAVLGCCASREMFNYTSKFEVRATVYSSIIALFENKINVEMDDCIRAADSHFQARNTYLDFNKLTFEYLAKLDSRADFLIIDFAETVSNYYLVNVCDEKANYEAKITANPFVKNVLNNKNYRYEKKSSQDIDIKALVEKFFTNVFLIYPKDRVILNRVSFSKFYIDAETVMPFIDNYRLKQENLDRVRKFENEAKNFVDAKNILEPIEYCASDKKHLWGQSPVHYFVDDYNFMARRLENMFGFITENELYESYCNLYKNSREMMLKNLKP